MDDKWLQAIVATFTALAGLALVAVLVSKNSDTSGVVSSVFSGYAGVLKAAVSPVSGSASASANS